MKYSINNIIISIKNIKHSHAKYKMLIHFYTRKIMIKIEF